MVRLGLACAAASALAGALGSAPLSDEVVLLQRRQEPAAAEPAADAMPSLDCDFEHGCKYSGLPPAPTHAPQAPAPLPIDMEKFEKFVRGVADFKPPSPDQVASGLASLSKLMPAAPQTAGAPPDILGGLAKLLPKGDGAKAGPGLPDILGGLAKLAPKPAEKGAKSSPGLQDILGGLAKLAPGAGKQGLEPVHVFGLPDIISGFAKLGPPGAKQSGTPDILGAIAKLEPNAAPGGVPDIMGALSKLAPKPANGEAPNIAEILGSFAKLMQPTAATAPSAPIRGHKAMEE